MKQSRKQNVKKYIAGILTIALAAGVCQSYGSIEVSAQEKTLPGIEKLVQETVNSGETFHILEVVASKGDASIGYLIGGEEPIVDGRKLSEIPLQQERVDAMAAIAQGKDSGTLADLTGADGPVSFSAYSEGSGALRTEDIRGRFVRNTENAGKYNYNEVDAQYRMLASGEEHTAGKSYYDRYITLKATDVTDESSQTVTPVFSHVSQSTSSNLETSIGEGENAPIAYTETRYALMLYEDGTSDGRMSSINTTDFVADSYIGREVYQQSGENTYLYIGKIVKGSDLPEGYIPVTADDDNAASQPSSVSDNDPAGTESQSVSGNEAVVLAAPEDEESGTAKDISNNLYVLNLANTTPHLWAEWIAGAEGQSDSYTLDPIADGYFMQMTENTSGEYYISTVIPAEAGDYQYTDRYQMNDQGRYELVSEGTVEVIGVGAEGFDADRSYDFVGDDRETPAEISAVSYSGGYNNKEWFRKKVLNLSGEGKYEGTSSVSGDMDSLKIEVTTLTWEELADLAKNQTYHGIDLDSVNLIYLSGRSAAVETEDTAYAATAIAKLAYGITGTDGTRTNASRVPVIMDYGFYKKNSEAIPANTVLTRLAAVLLKVSDDNIAKLLAGSENFWSEPEVQALSMEAGVTEKLVETVYLYDDTTTPFVASDFITPITKEESLTAFDAVVKEIEYENFLIRKNDENATLLDGTDSEGNVSISKASITRYILNWYLQRVMVKSELNVLDLEPSYDFDHNGKVLTAEQVKTFMGMPDYNADNIHITAMTSAEFIGKIEDLNATYDLIYIGDYLGGVNTDSKGNTVFNDSNMDGLIYYHVGDSYDYSQESDQSNKLRLVDDSLDHASYVYRGPGNDMNSTKYEELTEYIRAGYPVVIADKFVNTGAAEPKADESRLDRNSYFYQFIKESLTSEYWQKNVFTAGLLDGTDAEQETYRNTFCNYLNLSKLSVEMIEKPLGLSYDSNGCITNASYLTKTDGKYQLQFVFKLSNDAALSATASTYDCKLFVDKNSDGRFSGSDVAYGTDSASEELSGLSVYELKDGEWLQIDKDAENGGLRVGSTYKVVRALPEDYVGVIPWKLVFYDKNSSSRLVRTAETGYSAVAAKSEGEYIHVLQIIADVKNGKDYNTWKLEGDKDFENLKSGLRDYTIDVDTYTVSALLELPEVKAELYTESSGYGGNYKTNEARYRRLTQYIQKQGYNMIIIGFADNFQFGTQITSDDVWRWGQDYTDSQIAKNMVVARVVRDFIASGNSVLFTHDTTSYINSTKALTDLNKASWYWGFEFNKTIRAAVGLDRYGALKTYYGKLANDTRFSTEQRQDYQDYYNTLNAYGDSNWDTLKEPNTDTVLGQQEGLTKYTVVRFMGDQLKNLNNGRRTIYFPVRNDLLREAWYGNSQVTSSRKNANILYGEYSKGLVATQVNEGQITQYPYLISKDETKSLKVATTHYQWLQPNMELDRDNDGKNDLVVWYCLSDVQGSNGTKNIYNICPNDVVNNYYIYNMGNVTYSGAGHSRPDSDTEMKLFVNTIVAAYKAGIKTPSVTFEDDYGNALGGITLLRDPVTGKYLDTPGQSSTIQVKFRAEDDNILSGNPQVCVEFYKECSQSDAGATTVAGIGKDIYVVPLNDADQLKVISSSGQVISGTVEDNVRYYKVANNTTYTLQITRSLMGISDADDSSETIPKIYVRVYTAYDGNKYTPDSSDSLGISTMNLLELN